jgi:hypothetical protein
MSILYTLKFTWVAPARRILTPPVRDHAPRRPRHHFRIVTISRMLRLHLSEIGIEKNRLQQRLSSFPSSAAGTPSIPPPTCLLAPYTPGSTDLTAKHCCHYIRSANPKPPTPNEVIISYSEVYVYDEACIACCSSFSSGEEIASASCHASPSGKGV